MNRKFSIFGSCVSRDVFGLSSSSEMVSGYVARCAIASAVSKPILGPVEQLDISDSSLSPFEQRMVRCDLMKEWFGTISAAESDGLVIDLIDDRFSVIEVGGRYLTESASLTKTEYYRQLQAGDHKLHTFFNRAEVDRQALPIFAEMVGGLGKRVYIHRAMWALEVAGESGAGAFEKAEYHSRMNEGLAWRYEALARLLPDAIVIEVPEMFRVADPGHRWGLAPFHYVEDYYAFVRRALEVE